MSAPVRTQGGASSSKRVLDDVDLTLEDDSESDSGVPGVPPPAKKSVRRSRAEVNAQLVQLVEASGSSEPDWDSIDQQLAIKNSVLRWRTIQSERETENYWTPVILTSRAVHSRSYRDQSDQEGTESDSDFEQSGPSDRVQRRTSGRVRRAVGTAADPTLQFVPQLETDRWTAEHVAALTSIVNEQFRARRLTGWSIIDQRVGREGCENRWFATLEMAEAKSSVSKAQWSDEDLLSLRSLVDSCEGSMNWDLAGQVLGRTWGECQTQMTLIETGQRDLHSSAQRSSSVSSSRLSSPLSSCDISEAEGSGSGERNAGEAAFDTPIDQQPGLALKPIAAEDDTIEIDPSVVAHNAAIESIERNVASSIAVVVALEARNRRMRAAKDALAASQRRMEAARDEMRTLEGREAPSSRAERDFVEDIGRVASGSTDKHTGKPPSPLSGVVDRPVAQHLPDASTSSDVQHPLSPPVRIATTAPSSAPSGLIYLGSDSSDEDSDDIMSD